MIEHHQQHSIRLPFTNTPNFPLKRKLTKVQQITKEAARYLHYFPELKDADDYITEFSVSLHRGIAKKFSEPLTPTKMFKRPDFGFNDQLVFDES